MAASFMGECAINDWNDSTKRARIRSGSPSASSRWAATKASSASTPLRFPTRRSTVVMNAPVTDRSTSAKSSALEPKWWVARPRL